MQRFGAVWIGLLLGAGATVVAAHVGLRALRHRIDCGEHPPAFAPAFAPALATEVVFDFPDDRLLFVPLEAARVFTTACVGYACRPSPLAAAFRDVLWRPDPEAAFVQLVEQGAPGARLFGLCGLRTIGSPRSSSYLSAARTDDRLVGFMAGCGFRMTTVMAALDDPRFARACRELSDLWKD
jgi:hypothetical protein